MPEAAIDKEQVLPLWFRHTKNPDPQEKKGPGLLVMGGDYFCHAVMAM
jgi:hypothetical protein